MFPEIKNECPCQGSGHGYIYDNNFFHEEALLAWSIEDKKFFVKSSCPFCSDGKEIPCDREKDKFLMFDAEKANIELTKKCLEKEKGELLREELKDLVRFLAHAHMEWESLRLKALSFPPEECKEFLSLKFPVMQGTRNRIALMQIGEQDCNMESVGKAIQYMMEK